MGWAVASGAVLLLCLTPGTAAAGGKVRIKGTLTATGVDANAQGKTGFAARGADGTLEVRVGRLDRRASYDLVVNGVKVASLQTGGGGSGRVRLRSRPKSKDLLLGFDPRGTHLSVRNTAGNDVLVGTMPSATVDPSTAACCVPDGNGGSTCQELTPDACTAASGEASDAATCIPDPCTATPPPTATVCCTNETGDDESESECEDDDTAECVAAGGMVVEATTCDPNPCAPVPPPNGDAVACCVTHENETECEVMTTEACTASNGTAMSGATCEPDPCGASGSDGNDDNGDGQNNDGGNGSSGDNGDD